MDLTGITSYSGYIFDLVSNHRADIQTSVQIVSHLLGLVHTLVLTTCFSNRTRLRFESRSVSLDRLQWWSTISSQRIDWSLPPQFLCFSILFVAASFIPAALWAGAITPISIMQRVPSTISTSFYQPDPSSRYWNNSWAPFRANVNYTDVGSFSYSPGVASSGLILKNAAAARSMFDTTVGHFKNDLTQYFYETRSYGVGASPGLVAAPGNNFSLKSSTYSGIGYQASVACIKNTSSLWGWKIAQDNTGHSNPSILYANGIFPDGANDNYAQMGYGLSDTIMSLSGHTNTERGFPAIPGGSQYVELNYTQCAIEFVPTNLTIGVDVLGSVINVIPNVAGADIINMDPTTSNGSFSEYGCIGSVCRPRICNR